MHNPAPKEKSLSISVIPPAWPTSRDRRGLKPSRSERQVRVERRIKNSEGTQQRIWKCGLPVVVAVDGQLLECSFSVPVPRDRDIFSRDRIPIVHPGAAFLYTGLRMERDSIWKINLHLESPMINSRVVYEIYNRDYSQCVCVCVCAAIRRLNLISPK